MPIAAFPAPTDTAPARAGIEERLGALIRLATVSSEPDERAAAAFGAVPPLLRECYPLLHERLELQPTGGRVLVFRWAPRAPSLAAPVVLMAHFDVVASTGQEWSFEPFVGDVVDGRVRGRGAIDDKGALVTLLDAVENLLAEGFEPAREVWLCLGGDEEVDGVAAAAVAEGFRARGVVPWFVVDEGGAVTDLPIPGVSGAFGMVGLTEKGVLNVRLETEGTGGHASAPPRLTAAGRIARAVQRVQSRPFPARLSRTVAGLLTRLAAQADGPARRLLPVAAAAGPLTARLATLAGPELAAMVRTTVAVTGLAGGTQANVLPSAASATLNIRIAPGETIAGVVARLERVIADPDVRVHVLSGTEPSPESPTDSEPWALLGRAADAAYPGLVCLPFVVTAATDSRHWHRFAPAVYRFAPLQLPAELRRGLHGADEAVDVDSLVRGERFYRALLQGLPA